MRTFKGFTICELVEVASVGSGCPNGLGQVWPTRSCVKQVPGDLPWMDSL